jgi:transmembrane sensor
MASPTERFANVRNHVVPEWTPEREHAVRARLDRAIVRRKRRQVVATATTALLFIVTALVVWSRGVGPDKGPTTSLARSAAAQTLLHFEDGSTVTGVGPEARVAPVEVSPEMVSTRLLAGTARFSVTPNPKRIFRVLARDVTVTVLGTIFTVGVEPGDVRVRVERGRVRVAWPAGEHDLSVGEELVVQTRVGVAAVASASPPGVPPAAHDVTSMQAEEKANDGSVAVVPRHGAERPQHPSTSWRELAQDGDYAGAFARMQSEGAGSVRDDPDDLLLSADVARLGGHPEKAVSPLSRVVAAHPGDSRAPLAAFTLGRTLLDQLGRPREAAEAFARARQLDNHGALAQDALAREVESWSRAGEASLAQQRATEYVERYPKGRRLAAVRRLGGLP